jgi:hypothetical protein
MPKSGEHRVNTIDSFFRVRPSSQNIREGENVSFLEDGKLIKQEKRNGVVYEQVYVEQGQAQAAARVGTSTGDITNVVISGSSSGSGDVTGITAGTGLTGGGSSGNINLNVVGGTGITANADDIAIDSTVTTLTGTQTLTNKTLTGPKTTGDVLNSGNVSGNTYKYYNSASNTLGNTAFTVSQSGEVNFAATVELTNSVFAADVNDGPVVNFYNNRTNPDQVVKLGTIQFSAPVSGSPGDISRLTAAYIEAKAHSTFSSSNNQTNLIFYTANNAIADETLRLNYNGSTTFNNAFTFPTADGSANQFLRTNGSGTVSWSNTLVSPTFTGTAQGANLTLTGDLTVGGTTTTLNAENLQVKDKNIVLNYLDGDSSSTADGAGITIQDAVNSSTDATMLWDATNDEFDFSHTVTAPDFTGDLTGNASTATTATTATTLATARNFSLTGDVTAGAVSFDGSGNVALSTTIAADSVALGTDTTGNYVGTITIGSGVSTSGASTGEGIAHNLSINAAQTAITSIYNSSLEIGSAADGQIIDFGTSDEIRLGSSTQTSVKIKTDPLGSAQDEVIIGAGTANVDFVVDGSSGSTIFKVDAGTGNTAVTGDLSISGSFNPATITASTSVRTPLIEFTDGDDAITIANGGGMTFAKGFTVTSGASSFGANVAIKNTGGTTLRLDTSSTDVDENGLLGRINFSAPDEFAGSASNLLAASIVAKATADFTSSFNTTDMIFELGVSETASEKFRIVSDGKIKIGGSYTLPSSDGSANQILKTNGSGTVSFADENTGISFNGSTANGLLTYGSSTTADVETDLVYTATGLGIGTSPEEKMHIFGDAPFLKIENNTEDTSGIIMEDAQDSGQNGRIVYDSGANKLYLQTHGGTGFTMDSSQNIGIGTTNPGYKLSVENELNVFSSGDTASPKKEGHLLRVIDTTNDNPDVEHFFVENHGLAYGMRWLYDGGANTFSLYRHNNSASGTEVIRFSRTTNNIYAPGSLRINGLGIGIGNNSPQNTLHVDATTSSNVVARFNTDSTFTFIDLYNDDSNRVQIGNADDGDFIIRTADAERVRINSSGNVGIGTANLGTNYKMVVKRATNCNLGVGLQGGELSLEAFNDAITASVPFRLYGSEFNMLGGSVGIGTTSPETNLHIGSGTQSVAALAGVGIANGASAYSFFSASDGTKQYIAGIDHTLTYSKAGTLSNHDHSIITNNVERIYIKNTGNVGIGTQTPADKLHVTGNIRTNGEIYLDNGGDSIAFMGVSDANYRKALYANNDNHYITNRHTGGDLILMSNNGSAGGETERLRFVAGSGTQNAYFSNVNVGIGGSPEGNAKLDIKMSGVSQYLKLERSSSSGRSQIQLANESGTELWRFGLTGGGSEDFVFYDGGANVLILDRSSNQAQFNNDVIAFATSDERLKENVKNIESPLEKLNKINGVEFDWIKKEGIHGNEGHDVGVIAQEIEEVLPEVVTTRDSGYKAVKYEKIVPLLIEAIKEQQKQIEELKNG